MDKPQSPGEKDRVQGSSASSFDPHSLLPKDHPHHPDNISSQTQNNSDKPQDPKNDIPSAPEWMKDEKLIGTGRSFAGIPVSLATPPTVDPLAQKTESAKEEKVNHPLLWNSSSPASPEGTQKPGPAFKTEKKRKPFTILLISLFVGALVVGIAGGGWYLWQQGFFAGVTVLSPVGPLSPVAVQPKAKPLSVGVLDSWSTYVSSESGFTIRHPADVIPTVIQEGDQTITVFTLVGPTQEKDTEFYDGISLQFMSGELGNSTLEEFVMREETDIAQHATVTQETTQTALNGVSGYTYAVSGQGDVTFTYLLDGGGYLKIANLTKDPGNLGYEKIAEDMLQTLRLTTEDTGESLP